MLGSKLYCVGFTTADGIRGGGCCLNWKTLPVTVRDVILYVYTAVNWTLASNDLFTLRTNYQNGSLITKLRKVRTELCTTRESS